jgi:hypothetical protein
MILRDDTYDVEVVKRGTGERIVGQMQDDGLQSLWPVETSAGEIHYVSVLDTFVKRELVGRQA